MEIRQEFAPKFVKRFRLHQRIGSFLHGGRKQRVFTKIFQMLLSINNDMIRRGKHIDFISIRKSDDVSKHGYTDKYGDLKAAIHYASQINHPDFSTSGGGSSFILYKEQINTLREFINDHRPKTVFNFGICFAHVDATLAAEFPDVTFVGIDLSKHNKAFNDCEFADISNLKILNGDVFEEFKNGEYKGAVLFHSRTLVLLPKAFNEKLYKAAYDAGFGWIVGFEPHGLSEETLEPYVFDLSDRPSIYWRGRMLLHNYLRLADVSGFTPIEARSFASGHSSPDFRFLCFIAKRK